MDKAILSFMKSVNWVGAKFDTANHDIPDDKVEIDDVYSSNRTEIAKRFAPYLSEHNVTPVLGTMGGNVVCIGESEENRGEVFYYDFDFGIFKLHHDIKEFHQTLFWN